MVNKIVNEYAPDHVSPPGDTLFEVLEDRSMSQAELASRTGRTAKHINQIIKGIAAITPETAIQLERVLGIPASFWNNRQCRFAAFEARAKEAEAITANLQWSTLFPYGKMAKNGWVDEVRDRGTRLRNLLNYFSVATPVQWESRWRKMGFTLRASETFEPDQYALAAWLRKGELIGQQADCEPYNADRFRRCLGDIRSFTTEPPSVFQPELSEICASCGVVVAFVKELPKTASGATRWLSADKALLQLSLKYKTDDQLWFTFFHEAGHILLHQKKKSIFIEGRRYQSREEQGADRFAADMLIPPADFQSLSAARRFSKSYIRVFARRVGIAPGVVVGRLQNAGLVPHSHLNDLKRRLRWADDSS